MFSVQYAENSTRDCDERMKAGAVNEDRSPLNDAMDYESKDLVSNGDMAFENSVVWIAVCMTHFQERGPGSSTGLGHSTSFDFRHDDSFVEGTSSLEARKGYGQKEE